jgi:hypothetical protein
MIVHAALYIVDLEVWVERAAQFFFCARVAAPVVFLEHPSDP